MSALPKRLRGWWRSRRRRNAAARNPSPLREFVYLDEVSVYSLLASRVGAVATDFTDTEIASLQTEVSASAGTAVPGLIKADAKSRIGSTQTQQTQVVRKALVQSAFKDLYEYEQQRLVLRSRPAGEPPRIRDAAEPADLPDAAPWVVSRASLARGELFEAEVELGAEGIFRMSAVVSAITEIVRESPELRAADLEQVSAIAGIIEQLLVGLIPLRGRVADFEVAVFPDGEERVVHTSLLDQMPPMDGAVRLPLFVVGVAEEGLFWKDVRRVLFSSSRYRALCRLARPGLQRTWTPVKLVDVLGDFAPGLAAQLNAAIESLEAAALGAIGNNEEASLLRVRLRLALSAYASDLSREYGGGAMPQGLEEMVIEAADGAADDGIEERRQAFAKVTRLFEREFSVEVDPVVAAQLRFAAWTESDRSIPSVDQSDYNTSAVSIDARYLDAEFVAIYW